MPEARGDLHEGASPHAGCLVTDVGGEDEEMRKLDLFSYRGRPVVLFFWTSWCPACAMSLRHVQKMQQAWADRGVTVIGVNGDENGRQALAELAPPGPSRRNLMDGESGPVVTAWGLHLWPTLVLGVCVTKGCAPRHASSRPGARRRSSANRPIRLRSSARGEPRESARDPDALMRRNAAGRLDLRRPQLLCAEQLNNSDYQDHEETRRATNAYVDGSRNSSRLPVHGTRFQCALRCSV
ncbi:MAG: TlpA disulfide reductase family protein [Planctomycetota bacterium]